MLSAMSPDEADLSPYELARLQKIRANRALLANLGIATLVPKPSIPSASSETSNNDSKKAKKRISEVAREREREPVEGERRSKRLRGVAAPRVEITEDNQVVQLGPEPVRLHSPDPEDVEGSRVRYDQLPIGPEELDDDEFEAYLVLRKWRLLLSKKLEKEAYKIFQNRTLAESIRRERNTPGWCNDAETMQECWGIGPSKAAEGGFGWDLAEELKSKEVVERLVESRKAGVPKEKEEQEEGEAQGECESGDGRADEAESPAKQESKEENSDEKDGDR